MAMGAVSLLSDSGSVLLLLTDTEGEGWDSTPAQLLATPLDPFVPPMPVAAVVVAVEVSPVRRSTGAASVPAAEGLREPASPSASLLTPLLRPGVGGFLLWAREGISVCGAIAEKGGEGIRSFGAEARRTRTNRPT